MTDSDKAIALRPSYWASVSGGKDSLYMLNYILHNLDRYPLDGVVHRTRAKEAHCVSGGRNWRMSFQE